MRILDCSALLPGPFVGKLFAEQGAEVIKIENPLIPDGSKLMGHFYDDLNSKKKILSINLKDPLSRPQFEELVRKSDGLIEAYRPDTKAKLGLDSATLHKINDKLSILSLIGFPAHSPKGDHPGHDLNFLAESGTLELFNGIPGLPLADLFSAYQGAFQLLNAIRKSQLTDAKGEWIQVSMTEALKSVLSGWALERKRLKHPLSPGKTLFSGRYPCYSLYTMKSGTTWAVGTIEPKYWAAFCNIIGLQNLQSEGFAEGPRASEVKSLVLAALETRKEFELEEAFTQAKCCVNRVLSIKDAHGL